MLNSHSCEKQWFYKAENILFQMFYLLFADIRRTYTVNCSDPPSLSLCTETPYCSLYLCIYHTNTQYYSTFIFLNTHISHDTSKPVCNSVFFSFGAFPRWLLCFDTHPSWQDYLLRLKIVNNITLTTFNIYFKSEMLMLSGVMPSG